LLLQQSALRALPTTGVELPKTFALLAQFVKSQELFDAAVEALSQIPRSARPTEQIPPLLEALLQHLRGLSPQERLKPEARRVLQLAYELSAGLPPERAQTLRRELADLGVRVLVVRAVPHLLLFDRRELYVEAGKPVEIVFQNTDIMPHNFVLGTAGSLLRLGRLSDDMATDPNAYRRHFVPASSDVLYHTRLLQPGEEDRILMTAPQQVGDYPYVCTYPGHWRQMNGVLRVVADLDQVPADRLAGQEGAAEPWAASRRFVRSWTLEELTPLLDEVGPRRDLARGKQLFQELACSKCHGTGASGTTLGVELATIRAKVRSGEYSPEDVLRSIVRPSEKVAPECQITVIITRDGRVLSGIVRAKTDARLVLATNPLEDPQRPTIEVAVSDIEEQTTSATSMMPEGLLNTAEREEIVDLLSYVMYGSDHLGGSGP
jgi:putative heme-binding domain-containing protein